MFPPIHFLIHSPTHQISTHQFIHPPSHPSIGVFHLHPPTHPSISSFKHLSTYSQTPFVHPPTHPPTQPPIQPIQHSLRMTIPTLSPMQRAWDGTRCSKRRASHSSCSGKTLLVEYVWFGSSWSMVGAQVSNENVVIQPICNYQWYSLQAGPGQTSSSSRMKSLQCLLSSLWAERGFLAWVLFLFGTPMVTPRSHHPGAHYLGCIGPAKAQWRGAGDTQAQRFAICFGTTRLTHLHGVQTRLPYDENCRDRSDCWATHFEDSELVFGYPGISLSIKNSFEIGVWHESKNLRRETFIGSLWEGRGARIGVRFIV